MEEKKISIEENLEAIDKITSELENGDLSLEESLKRFEEGIRLIRESEAYLGDVEKRLQTLREVQDDGNI